MIVKRVERRVGASPGRRVSIALPVASSLFALPSLALAEDIEWQLAFLRGTELAANAPATLTFATDGSVSGTGGCNRIGGAAKIAPPSLEFGDMFSSMMACEDDAMAQERGLLEALENTASFTVSADTLSLIDASGTEVARFVRAE
jgi:putative lipoprotein